MCSQWFNRDDQTYLPTSILTRNNSPDLQYKYELLKVACAMNLINFFHFGTHGASTQVGIYMQVNKKCSYA